MCNPEVATLAEDLLKSLASLDEMLKGMEKEKKIIDPHIGAAEAEPLEECPYCIKNGSYVRVSDDSMKAWILLYPPKAGDDFYSHDLIMQFLKENEIHKGYHTSNIAAIAKKHVYGREILVANGLEPSEGKNGYYEFFFDTSDKRKPAVREDGTVDYSSMSSLTNVQEGTVIAIYHHASPAKNGYDVHGKDIQAKASRDLPALRGRGISNEKNPDEYIATVSGKIDYVDGHIDIKNVHEVQGDVDLVMGKVEFFGDIHITGNVGTGVVIRASRNVTVDGVVEAAEIYAGGDIVLVRGIQGNQRGHVAAKGSVSADFIEHANIEAGGDIRSNSFINANVYAGGKVIAEGKNGLILGGSVRGLSGVSAINIGNESETKTFVASGYSEEDYARYLESFQKETDAQKKLSEIVEKMTEIVKQKRLGKDINSDATDRLLLTLNEKKDELFEALDKAKKEKEILAEIVEKGKGSVILANEKIYRGVTICVEGTKMQVPNNTSFMRYKNEAGRIVTSVIVVN